MRGPGAGGVHGPRPAPRRPRALTPIVVEGAYAWSSRWLDNEIELAGDDRAGARVAAEAHRDRMLEWVELFYKQRGQDVTRTQMSAGHYYLAEADYLVERLGGQPATDPAR